MAKAVFATRVRPSYDDLPEERYHFPRTYLNQAKAAVGDWIVYYEPRRHDDEETGYRGRQAYFATARVRHIEADRHRAEHFYAFVTDYLEFDRAVPFRQGDLYYESALQRPDGGTNRGAFGRAVRLLPEREYELILRAGFAPIFTRQAEPELLDALQEEPTVFERPIVERLSRRPFRDQAFALAVRSAYGETCAISGLRILNGGGRPEVQAAHIRPVAARGPDSVRNGLALSSTIHWMFDRGLITIDDDFRILTAKDRVPSEVRRLITPDRRLLLPKSRAFWPHPQFLRYRRDLHPEYEYES